MSTYSANGTGHRILARLDEGPAFFADLATVVAAGGGRRAMNNARHTVKALRADALVRVSSVGYEITADGLDALADLREGHSYQRAVPRAQVFGRRATA